MGFLAGGLRGAVVRGRGSHLVRLREAVEVLLAAIGRGARAAAGAGRVVVVDGHHLLGRGVDGLAARRPGRVVHVDLDLMGLFVLVVLLPLAREVVVGRGHAAAAEEHDERHDEPDPPGRAVRLLLLAAAVDRGGRGGLRDGARRGLGRGTGRLDGFGSRLGSRLGRRRRREGEGLRDLEDAHDAAAVVRRERAHGDGEAVVRHGERLPEAVAALRAVGDVLELVPVLVAVEGEDAD
mmetsp:Transcript_4595/g.13546  ORF Transcript_4595/g.13546 Transcript_4595/m.13546 type:complete len:237 (+) Transcript_4595:23-733(+)